MENSGITTRSSDTDKQISSAETTKATFQSIDITEDVDMKKESDMQTSNAIIYRDNSEMCLSSSKQETINQQITLQAIPLQTTSTDSNNNTYGATNLNSNILTTRNVDYSTPSALVVNELTNSPQDINSSQQHQNMTEQHFQPSTTTVNLSESNQSVYFMMQTSPLEFTATPTLVVSNGTSNNLKLKSSPTSTPAVAKKLYSPKHLENSNPIIGTNVVSLGSISSPISSSSSSLNTSPTGSKIVRDERRRANHNEVERRRRDNINKWIVELSKVIPDCSNDHSKHGQSKGGILEKTVQYLNDIKKTNHELHEHINSLQMLKHENEILREQNEMYKKENQYIKSKLGSSAVLIETIEDLQNSIEMINNSDKNNNTIIQQQQPTTSAISSSSSASISQMKNTEIK